MVINLTVINIFYIKNSNNNYVLNSLFEKILKIFNNNSPYKNLSYLYNNCLISKIPGSLIPHKDFRSCAISIPLVPVTPISWYSSDLSQQFLDDPATYKLVCSYDYKHAVSLINTSIYHGAPENKNERLFFQIGGFKENFQQVIKNINPSVILN